jgi:hypothetical protein
MKLTSSCLKNFEFKNCNNNSFYRQTRAAEKREIHLIMTLYKEMLHVINCIIVLKDEIIGVLGHTIKLGIKGM